MATVPVIAGRSETALRSTRLLPPATSHHHPRSGACLATALLLATAFVPALGAQVPGLPEDEGERAWYMTFMSRFNARVLPSFRVDPEIQSRVARVWDAMVLGLARERSAQPSPLDQYPLLSFVDDRFVVMKTPSTVGEESFVVRSDEALAMPTLTSSLVEYLDRSVYASLRTIAEEEKAKLEEHPDYEPRLAQLAAQNPYQHGLPIRVPDLGPFKNRMVAFTGLNGRLTASEIARYDQQKWTGRPDQVVGLMHQHRWGVAIELADLEHGGEVMCRYRLVRPVAAVRDSFIGKDRRGVLVRQPRLGPVIEISGCLANCEEPTSWARIYPEAEVEEEQPQRPRRSLPMVTADEGIRGEPGLFPGG